MAHRIDDHAKEWKSFRSTLDRKLDDKEWAQFSNRDKLPQRKFPYHGLITIGSYVKKELLIFIVLFITYGITAFANMGFAMVIENIDEAFTNPDSTWNLYAPLAVIGLTIIRALSSGFGGMASAYISNIVGHRLTNRMYRHIIRLPLAFYSQSSVGELMSKMSYNVGAISEAIRGGLVSILQQGLTLIVLLGYLFYLNWYLTLIILAVMPFAMILAEIARRRLKVLSKRLQKGSELMSKTVADVFSSLSLVRVLAAEKYETERYRSFSSFRKKEAMKSALVGSITMPLLQIILSLPFGLIIWIGLNSSGHSFATTGEFLAYLTAAIFIASPIRSLTGVQAALQAGEIAAIDYLDHLSISYEEDKGTIMLKKDEVKGKIELRDVHFAYEEEKPVLGGLNLTIEAGKKTALVGISGSGKSTIINLILRLYTAQQGNIYLDGIKTRDINLSSLRANIGYVSQGIFLFNHTLRYNLLYGLDEPVDDDRIKEVLTSAHAWDFIEEMPKGLDTKLGDKGVRLSGGQQQRISLARALLKNTKILILDEATSALDVEAEYKIRKNIDTMMEGRTVLAIAHRLSTITQMDRIILLSHGKIAEEGTHQELLANKARYADLCSYQFRK